MAKRRAEFFDGKKCKCGAEENLQLDHINPSEKISHRVWSWNKEKRDIELSKCQALCEKCHKEKTREQATVKIHGLTMYRKHSCRCEICCESLRTYWRDYREQKKYSLVAQR